MQDLENIVAFENAVRHYFKTPKAKRPPVSERMRAAKAWYLALPEKYTTPGIRKTVSWYL